MSGKYAVSSKRMEFSIDEVKANLAERYGGDVSKLSKQELAMCDRLAKVDKDGSGQISLGEILHELEQAGLSINIEDVKNDMAKKYNGDRSKFTPQEKKMLAKLDEVDADNSGLLDIKDVLDTQLALEQAGLSFSLSDVEKDFAKKYDGDKSKFSFQDKKVLTKLKDIDEDGSGLISLEEILEQQFKLEEAGLTINIKAVEERIVSKYKGKIEDMSEQDRKLIKTLKDVDTEGDGDIEVEELLTLNTALQDSEKAKEQLKKLLILVVLGCLGLMILMFTMTFAANEASKEAKASPSGAMIAAKPTAAASESAASTRRRLEMSGDQDVDHMGPGARRALGVRKSMQQRKLASTMPDKFFKELDWLELTSPSSSTVSLKILSIVRIPRKSAKCGSLLLLISVHGKVILDDTDMAFDDNIGELFSEAGFEMVREDSPLSLAGRRLKKADGFEAKGFFNVIGDGEWKCSSVKKPVIPQIYSSHSTVLKKCTMKMFDGKDKDMCKVELLNEPVDANGIYTSGGIKYYRQEVYKYQSATGVKVVTILPHHPNTLSVTHTTFGADGDTITYQYRTTDGLMSHCGVLDKPTDISFPNDYIFNFVGEIEGTPKMRHFRISYKPTLAGTTIVQQNWEHIDYFDDALTQLPMIQIDPYGNIQTYKELCTDTTACSIKSFKVHNISYDNRKFDKCMAARQLHDDNNFTFIQESVQDGNITVPSIENVTVASSSEAYKLNSWDWNMTYPATAGGIPTLSTRDLEYHKKMSEMPGITGYGDWKEWYNHSTHLVVEKAKSTVRRLYDIRYKFRRHLDTFSEAEFLGLELADDHKIIKRNARGLEVTIAFGTSGKYSLTLSDPIDWIQSQKLYVIFNAGDISIEMGLENFWKFGASTMKYYVSTGGCRHGFCFEGAIFAEFPRTGYVSHSDVIKGGSAHVRGYFSMTELIDEIMPPTSCQSAHWFGGTLKQALGISDGWYDYNCHDDKDIEIEFMKVEYKFYTSRELVADGVTYKTEGAHVLSGFFGMSPIVGESPPSWWTYYSAGIRGGLEIEWSDNQDEKITGCDSTCQQLWSSRKAQDDYQNIEYKSIGVYPFSFSIPVAITYGKGMSNIKSVGWTTHLGKTQKFIMKLTVDYKLKVCGMGVDWTNFIDHKFVNYVKVLPDQRRRRMLAAAPQHEVGVTRTINGHKCQKWTFQYPRKHDFADVGDHDYCADPDNSGYKWCYTVDNSEGVPEREKCDMERTTTRTGKTCQNWSDQWPHEHKYTNVGNHNYCRNPDNSPFDWCLTTDPNKVKEICL